MEKDSDAVDLFSRPFTVIGILAEALWYVYHRDDFDIEHPISIILAHPDRYRW